MGNDNLSIVVPDVKLNENAPARYVEVKDDGELLVILKKPEFDISGLELGKRYTYKELTKLLCITYTTGEAKQKQLQDLGNYVKLQKQGTRYLVLKKYSSPKPKKIQFPPYSKYVGEMVDMLLIYLFNKGSEAINLDFNELYEVCGLVNKQYLFYLGKKEELAAKNNMTADEIRQFYFVAGSFVRQLVKRALNTMSTKAIIMYYEYYEITLSQGPEREILRRPATDDELSVILSIERETLRDLGFKTTREANASYLNRERFFKRFNELVQEHDPYWLKIQKQYRVIAPMKIVISEIISSKYRRSLNEKVFKYLTEHSEKEQFRYNGYLGHTKEWKTAQDQLADMLILL